MRVYLYLLGVIQLLLCLRAVCITFCGTQKYVRLVSEIRGAFAHASGIKLSALNELPYLNDVMTENLRTHPPIPSMLPRLVPQGGAVIDGQHVPGRVSSGTSR